MARVIYTGPLNPVIFARAKKEAEKAERIKGYTPRVIKTPSHTVVYNKTGPEVKAVVMDMLAPITFSIPGSAIPVAPNFLHLHPDLPKKVYGRDSKVTIDGYTNHGFCPTPISYYVHPMIHEEGEFAEKSAVFGYHDVVESARYLWDKSDGDFKENIFNFYPGKYMSGSGNGAISIRNTREKSHASINSFSSCSFSYKYEAYHSSYSFRIESAISGEFFSQDIRKFNADSLSTKGVKKITQTSFCVASIYDLGNVDAVFFGSKSSSESIAEYVSDVGAASTFYGETAFPFSRVSSKRSVKEDYYNGSPGSEPSRVMSTSGRYSISCGVYVNLSNDRAIGIDIESREYSESGDQQPNYNYSLYVNNPIASVCILSSCGGFDGIIISCKTHSKWPGAEKIAYDENSLFIKSHLGWYFEMFRGKYRLSDAPHLNPPKITTDGICLPHAWWFCRGNETRQTDFYPNNHNRLSIVIYPQGRHKFSVDEAEIVSVELNHTPRFVARPGGGIAFVMHSLFGGNKPVPYVVNGLVEERDERGEPTGFYLAQDGAISGEFKARPNGGSNPFASFKLSPRQAFDGYRTVTVETTTERKYGVQTTFDVRGGGGVRVQQPPSITLERINESVLAGQSTVFYVTATQMAVGSNLRYAIKRAGTVVSAGYIELGNCAGWVEFTAPFRSISVPGDPARYVLGDKSAPSTTPSTVEFEFSIIHEQAPPPVTFSVKFAHKLYASSTDRPDALPMPPLFFLQPQVSENGEEDFLAANRQTALISRIYYSLQSKRVYVLFWDGQSCDVSGILRQNPDTGQYEYNPDWKETLFDYPPAVDPYNIKGTLEPYVYAYMDYEKNRNNGA